MRSDSLPGSRSDSSSEREPRKSLRLTIVGAIAGVLIGHQIGEGDTLTKLAGAAMGAYGARHIPGRKR